MRTLTLVTACFFGGLALISLVPVAVSPDHADLQQIVAEYYDDAFLSRAADYHRLRIVLFFIQSGILLGSLGLLVASRFGNLGRWVLSLTRGRAWLGRLMILSAVYVGLALIRLPFSITRFFHAKEYGLRHDSLADFLLDVSKALGIGWILVVVVGLIVLGLFAALPRWWWALSACIIALLAVGYTILSPVIIDPLFHEFRKLDDRSLENRIGKLGRGGGVDNLEVFISDAGRRSRAANAYFTGFGSTQRIVLHDTLVNNFDANEVAVIVAHEIGHWREEHISKGLTVGIIGMCLGLFVSHLILGWCVDNRVGGLSSRGDPGLVIPAYGLYTLLMYAAIVPGNWVSREMETKADLVSLELTRDPDTFIQVRNRIAHQNLSEVLPSAPIEFAFYTHPCNAKRILMAKQFKRLDPSDSPSSRLPVE